MISSSAGGYCLVPERSNQSVRAVSFCELTTHPERFENRLIRISAIMITALDTWYLYDPKCPQTDRRLDYSLEGDTKSVSDRMDRLAIQNREGDGETWRTGIVATGKLHVESRTDRSGRQLRVLKFSITNVESAFRIHNQ
jgi:hypothetical protein